MRTAFASLAFFAALAAPAGAQTASSLQICVERYKDAEEDFAEAFKRGPIRVPAGTVFDLAGPAFGPASDPRDMTHAIAGGGWRGVSKEEAGRRGKLLVQHMDSDRRHRPGLITLSEVRLTRARPCAEAPVAAVDAPRWGWTVSPVYGSSETYFQTYGVVRGSKFEAGFDDDRDPLSFAAMQGEINGILKGTTDRVIRLPE